MKNVLLLMIMMGWALSPFAYAQPEVAAEYSLTVLNGTISQGGVDLVNPVMLGIGEVVTITANDRSPSERFVQWRHSEGPFTLFAFGVRDFSEPVTTFTMTAAFAADVVIDVEYAGLHQLTVTNGTGSGWYESGAVVPVQALAVKSTHVFDGWIGDVAVLDDSAAESTFVTMPVGDVQITANYLVDTDGDGLLDPVDNCPFVPNRNQADGDGDQVGDLCDVCFGFDDRIDTDLDTIPDGCDVCPGSDDLVDTDGDTVPDGCDNCPRTPNIAQADLDGDGTGDLCESASSGDKTNDNNIGVGIIETDGRFSVVFRTVAYEVFGSIYITGGPAGLRVSYEAYEGDPDGDDLPGPGGGTVSGFGDPAAFDRWFIAGSEADGSLVATVSIRLQEGELAGLGVAAQDLRLHVLDDTHEPIPGLWQIAGDDIGESWPAGVVGQTGFFVSEDGSATYWAVVDRLGAYAVAAVLTDMGRDTQTDGDGADEPDEGGPGPGDEGDNNLKPICPGCGLGMAQSLMMGMAGLLLMHARRRWV